MGNITSGYDWDEGVYVDPNKTRDANWYAGHMAFLLDVDVKNHLINEDTLLFAIKNWILLGRLTRGDNYTRSVGYVFFMPRSPRPIAKNAKYSALLLDALKLLENVPADASHTRHIYFHQGEGAMIDYVYAFRLELEKRDPKRASKFLADVKRLVMSDWQLNH